MEEELLAVLFIDMVNSTQLKYDEPEETVAEMVAELYERVTHSCPNAIPKFTGDGAMVLFAPDDNENEEGLCCRVLKAAERIARALDLYNVEQLGQDPPRPLQVRMGISCGKCFIVGHVGQMEVSGRAVDLASRLCAEADPGGILVSQAVRDSAVHCPLPQSAFARHRFKHCARRLTLRGVPANAQKPELFYHFVPRRFLPGTLGPHFNKGFLRLYTDRPRVILSSSRR